MWTADYFIRYAKLPLSVEGVTIPNSDGSFDIYLNSALPEARQRAKLRHELEHIRQDHFYVEAPVFALEMAADGEAPPAPPRRRTAAPCLQAGERARVIPLFQSLEQLQAFYETLLRDGRCGDYVLRQEPAGGETH